MYSHRAQTVAWIDYPRFVVGRWDGTITVHHHRTDIAEPTQDVAAQLRIPSSSGVQMVIQSPLSDQSFISSNDESSLVLWDWDGEEHHSLLLTYNGVCGTAVSAAIHETAAGKFLVIGHEHGYLTFWEAAAGTLRVIKQLAVRSPSPVTWPDHGWHVRGLSDYSCGRIISASEDGDLCIVTVPKGEIVYRVRYSQEATRGLNDLATLNDWVIGASCSGEDNEENLWLFKKTNDSLQSSGAIRLVKSSSRPRSFCFSVELCEQSGSDYFFATTEEGLLWVGRIKRSGQMEVLRTDQVAESGGAALSFAKAKPILAIAAYEVHSIDIDQLTDGFTANN